jgi:ribosomal protein S18 acetylase RimI-like enzyme
MQKEYKLAPLTRTIMNHAIKTSMTIRNATIEDATELGKMHVASWRETYTGILPEGILSSLSVPARVAKWQEILREPASVEATVVHVMESDGNIIGFGSCGPQRTENLKVRGYAGEFSGIYVLRAFQRHGVGARLMSIMASDLASRGFNAASLWVLRDNAVARQFYERFGGQVVEEREDVRGQVTLVELAYGWANLRAFEAR